MPSELVRDLLYTLNAEVLSKLDLTRRQVKHPSEGGRSREQIIRDFLASVVPTQYGVDTGFVIDATGRKSKQIDIVIHRRDYHPVFEIGGLKHFLLESVVVVTENKASLASASALLQALENVQSVKTLDRTNRGENYTLVGHTIGGSLNPDEFQHQVFGALLTEESLNRETLAQALLDFLRSTPRNEWPNFYADVRHLTASFLKSVDSAVGTVIPSEANYLFISDNSTPNFVPPLVEVAKEIADFLRVAPLVDYKTSDYILQEHESIK